jgi:hypothetical protein
MEKEKVFIWKNWEEWLDEVYSILVSIFPKKIINSIISSPPDDFYIGDPYFVEQLADATQLQTKGEIIDQITREFIQTYSIVRLYHACHPKDLGEYYRRGLRILDFQEQVSIAKELFLDDDLVSESSFNYAVGEASQDGREGKLYLSVCDDTLKSLGGLYLLYGSEYLSIIANRLTDVTGKDFLVVLRDRGIPTMWICDVPIENLHKEWFADLISNIVTTCFGYHSDIIEHFPQPDFTFEFTKSLPPSVIKDHYHPNKVYDPIRGNPLRSDEPIFCSHC